MRIQWRCGGATRSFALLAPLAFIPRLAFSGNILLSHSMTYQGQLKSEGLPVEDICSMQFALWNSPVSTNLVDRVADVEQAAISVANGLFTAILPFSPTVFDGRDLWLEVGVYCPNTPAFSGRQGDNPPPYVLLSPRQPITGAAYAINTRGMYVDGIERVGLGTLAPGAKLTISRPAQAPAHQLELRNAGSITSPNLDGIRFSQGSTGATTLASIDVLYRNNGSPDLSFSLRNLPNVLFLRADGNVGIGSTAPENVLHVHKGSAGSVSGHAHAPLIVENSTTSYVNILSPSANESGLLFGNPLNNSAGGVIYNNSATANGLQFRTNSNTTRMVINSAGDVGIGTTTPLARLQVVGPDNDGTNSGLRITSGSQHLLVDGNEIDSNGDLFLNNNVPDDVILANGGGFVGIDVTPTAKLDVNGDVLVRGDLRQALRTCTTRKWPYDFQVTESGKVYQLSTLAIRVPISAAGQSATFGAAVHIPHGSRITQMRALIEDDAPAHEITVQLRSSWNVGALVATVSSVAIPNLTTLSVNINHVVDTNDTNASYAVEAFWTRPGSGLGDIQLRWVELDYETEDICPPR